MTVDVKICGLSTHETVAAAIEGGARSIGFVFYPSSPRAVTPDQALDLGRDVPPDRLKVGVMVDPDERLLDQTSKALDAIQIHGSQSPEHLRQVKEKTGKVVIKGLSVGEASDLDPVSDYAGAADMLLFDAKAPKTPGSLPGGNGLSFDWRLLQGLELPCPWLLAGGLHLGNLADAVRLCRPGMVDVSSGVETKPGVKDVAKILDFLRLAATLQRDADTG